MTDNHRWVLAVELVGCDDGAPESGERFGHRLASSPTGGHLPVEAPGDVDTTAEGARSSVHDSQQRSLGGGAAGYAVADDDLKDALTGELFGCFNAFGPTGVQVQLYGRACHE